MSGGLRQARRAITRLLVTAKEPSQPERATQDEGNQGRGTLARSELLHGTSEDLQCFDPHTSVGPHNQAALLGDGELAR